MLMFVQEVPDTKEGVTEVEPIASSSHNVGQDSMPKRLSEDEILVSLTTIVSSTLKFSPVCCLADLI